MMIYILVATIRQVSTSNVVYLFLKTPFFQQECNCSVSDTFYTHSMNLFVQTAIEEFVDKRLDQRVLVGKMFQHLFMTKVLNAQHIVEGTKEIFEMIDDFIIDIPQIREYFGDIFGKHCREKIQEVHS